MNFKLIFKSLLIIAVLVLLVIMGMNNRKTVELSMPFLPRTQTQPAALMYIAFFGLGFLCGAVLMSGGGSKKSGGGGSSAKPARSQS